MTEMNKVFLSEKDKADFVNECEIAFNKRLDEVCRELTSRPQLKIIALSGPTCSGKTTTAHKLIGELDHMGRDVHLISIDDFFKERDVSERHSVMSTNTGLDYDSVNAIDLELLKKCAESIIACEPTVLPRYDFTTGKRSYAETVDPEDNSIFIFEGIQAIYPEVTALFGDAYSALHISVDDDLSMNGQLFSRRDIRLMRRIVRDYKFRGAQPEFTLYLWRSVVLNEERSITPLEDRVELRINSLMPYEVFLLRDELLPLLSKIEPTDRNYARALEYIEKLSGFDSIPPSMIPTDSLMREFIG